MWARNVISPALFAAAVALAVAPSSLRSDTPDPIPVSPPPVQNSPAGQAPSFESLIKSLHSTTYKDRDEATWAMLRMRPELRTDVENALARETDVETIARLTTVAVHLFLKDPRMTPLAGESGMMGIRPEVEYLRGNGGEDDLRKAVVVGEVKPGFPAYEVLKASDRIIAIDDRPFPMDYTAEDFRAKVQSESPGSYLKVTVLRGGKQFKAAVQLAGVGGTGDDQRTSFVERRERGAKVYRNLLKPGEKGEPLVMKDTSPLNANEDDIEVQGGH